MRDDKKIVLFDGVCNLCNGLVQFIIKHDQADRFRFAALQSDVGRQYLQRVQFSGIKDTIVLIEKEQGYMKSAAALRIFRALKGYKWMGIFMFIPRRIRDFGYDLVARNRYKWFGRRDSCMVPTAELKAKFLDEAQGKL